MPTYEYECKSCNHRFDVFHSMNDKSIKKCENCDGDVRRLFSPGCGIIFKGPGFYVNDYKKKESSNGGKSANSTVNNKSENGKPEKDKSDSTSSSSTSSNESSSSTSNTGEARSA